MTVYLLDANVLIALIDRQHVDHDAATDWFVGHADDGWATCPLTENAVLRIVGNPAYRNSPGPPSTVVEVLVDLTKRSGHVFWPDAISLLDVRCFTQQWLPGSAHLTDTYLLGLAKFNGGALATFDRRIVTDAVEESRHLVRLIR